MTAEICRQDGVFSDTATANISGENAEKEIQKKSQLTEMETFGIKQVSDRDPKIERVKQRVTE